MEHDDDRTLSTRDIASPAEADEPRFERRPGESDLGEDPAAGAGPLLLDDDQRTFTGRWQDIQAQFVDDPQRAVEDADTLVASVMQRLADGFAEERERLEGMWARGEDVGTEDLRVALQRYRSFFQRLLST